MKYRIHSHHCFTWNKFKKYMAIRRAHKNVHILAPFDEKSLQNAHIPLCTTPLFRRFFIKNHPKSKRSCYRHDSVRDLQKKAAK